MKHSIPPWAARAGGGLAAVALVFLGALPARADISVNPVHAEITASAKTKSFTVSNGGLVPRLVQIKVFSWRQENGNDILTPAAELLAVPPVFTVQPGTQQTVRVALREYVQGELERTYRLLISEVPDRVLAGMGVALAVQYSVPIFAEPLHPSDSPPRWALKRVSSKRFTLVAVNAANVHAKGGHIRITAPGSNDPIYDGTIAGYILAGQTRSWTFDALKAIPDGPLEMEVRSDAAAYKASLQAIP